MCKLKSCIEFILRYLCQAQGVKLHQEQQQLLLESQELCRHHFHPTFFIRHCSTITFVFSAGHTFTHTYQRPLQPYINSNLFHLRLDADDRLIRRTNSIIMNNPRSWQPHKKSLDEWVVYLLQCMQCRVQAWPAKMPFHYEAAEPCDQSLRGNWISLPVFLSSRQAKTCPMDTS